MKKKKSKRGALTSKFNKHEQRILDEMTRPGYKPIKPAALAKRLKLSSRLLPEFEAALERLIERKRVRQTRNGTLRPIAALDTVVGVMKKTSSGAGYLIPHDTPPGFRDKDVYIAARDMKGALTGDEVIVRLSRRRRSGGQRCGHVEEILQRATNIFVGTYVEIEDHGYVRIDGTLFPDLISVGDPGAKGAQPDDKVVVEMLRFPTHFVEGEAVLTKVLGKRGDVGVDTLSIIHEFGLPHEFPEAVLENSRQEAQRFDPEKLEDRRDLTKETIVTIDPVDARDFDDAISLTKSRNGHWHLGVHIADVAHFVRPGTPLDEEARQRGTSVYLPNHVIPMLPEIISNGLASLQQGHVRFTKSVFVEFSPEGIPVHTEFARTAIKVTRRFAYEEVMPIIQNPNDYRGRVSGKVRSLLLRMHELAMLLRKRRFAQGALELHLPEIELEFNADGEVIGAHESEHDESHQIIEEFMLAANIAVATELSDRGQTFLRRVHAPPDERKLKAFAEFSEALGLPIKKPQSREELQKLVKKAVGKPVEYAINYALLRSMKQAEYSDEDIGHYALNEDDYCHFTSPIRRYPDLTVHRLIDQLLLGSKRKKGKVEADWRRLGKHCSLTERRAADAERELTKVKLLSYMATRIGESFDAVITGVESFGIFCKLKPIPVEGLIHVTALESGEYFDYDKSEMALTGRRRGRRYRLGDSLRVEVVRVDVDRRELDLRVAQTEKDSQSPRQRRTSRKSKKNGTSRSKPSKPRKKSSRKSARKKR
ncbi:MAG: VacB/RNase II family 3'-5' exoribonuclease [Planctomycetaceae bacterium]